MANLFSNVNVAILIAAAVPGAFGAIWAIGTAVKWFVLGKNIKRYSPKMSAVCLLLALVMAITSVFVPAQAPATVNADNGGLAINVDPNVEVPMCGYATNSELEAYFRDIYGNEKFDEIRNTITERNFFPENDQAKIQQNKEYLQKMGYGKDYPDGFRDAVLFPSNALKAEDWKNLGSWTAEQLEDLYKEHRYYDVDYNALTNVRYADALLQNVENLPEFQAQNSQDDWAARLRGTIDDYKRDGKSVHIIDENNDGEPDRYDDELFFDLCRLCMVYENAVIFGVGTPTSTVNWSLPSLNVQEVEERWTVKLAEPADQENLPAFLWGFPNVKSGKNAYTRAVNTSDLRPEEVDRETPPVTPEIPTQPAPNPGPGPGPKTVYHTVYTFFRIKDTDIDVAQTATKTVAEGASWSTSAKDITGYDYVGNSNGNTDRTVTGVMGSDDVRVYFWYEEKEPQLPEDPIYFNIEVQHWDEDANRMLDKEVIRVRKGSSTTVSARSIDNYRYDYNNCSIATDPKASSVTFTDVSADMMAMFYYYREFNLTTLYVEEGTGVVVHPASSNQYRGNANFTARAADVAGYELVGNSVEGRSTNKTVTGAMEFKDQTVTFYYKAVAAQSYTVTTYHKVIGTNALLDTATQTVTAGQPYTTSKLNRDGYTYKYTTGDAPNGTMPNRSVEVTYWYVKEDAQSFDVNVNYVDENGTNLTTPLNWKQVVGTRYVTEQKSFANYTFKEIRGDKASDTMPARNVTVTYVYTKNAETPKEFNVNVKYLVELDGMSPELDSLSWKQTAGTNYTTQQKNFEGYVFSRVTGDKTSGQMPERDINVTYWYTVALKEFSVTASYVDEAGNNLTAPLSWKQVEGTTYTTEQKPFANYTFKEVRGDATSGIMPSRDVRVTYVYTKNPDAPKEYNILVTYQAEDTNIVLDTRSWKQAEGSYYETNRLPFDGYEFSKITGDPSKGTMPNHDVALTYWYKRGPEEPQMFTVTTQYRVVGDNSARLKSDDVQTVQAGKPYSTKQESFTGYTFSYTSGEDTSGTMPFHNITVAYWYDKDAAPTYKVTETHKSVDSDNLLHQNSWDQEVGTQYTTHGGTYQGYHFVGLENGSDAESGTMPSRSVSVVYLYALDVNEGDEKDPGAGPGNNGTGNATEGTGEGEGEEDPYIPPVIVDTGDKKGDEDTSNHLPTDNDGQHAADSEERQEVGPGTTDAIIPDNQDTESSGNGGQDKVVNVDGTDHDEGTVPPSKEDPADPGESSGSGDDGKNVDIDDSRHDQELDFEP